MIMDPLSELSQNIALLVALAFVYSLLIPRFQHFSILVQNLIQGLVFGLFGILSVFLSLQVEPGVLLDGRGIIISMAAYFGGALSGLVAALMVSIFRLFLGGPGVLISVPNAILFALIGIAFVVYERRRSSRLGTFWFLIIGLVNAFNEISPVLVFSSSLKPALLQEVILSIAILFPIGTWVLGTLLRNQQQQYETLSALVTEQARLRTLIDHIPDYIFIKDRNGRFIVSNSAHTRAAQARSDNALRGKTASNFFPSALAAQFNEDDQSVLQGQPILAQERRTVDAEGDPIWVVTTKVPLRDRRGEVIGLVGISHDVTQRKLAEEALQVSEKKYRQIIETASEGIWMVDAEGRTTFVNPRMASMLGRTVDEMQGKLLLDFVDEKDRAEATAHLERRRKGLSEEYDFRFVKNDGSVIWAIVSTTPVLDENNQYVGALKMLTDITDRKRAEAQELELTAERQRVQILKRFINDISHDFRTPLTILQTSVSLLSRTATDQQQRRIEILGGQVRRLTKLMDSMLDVYSLEDDQPVYLSAENVNSIVSRVAEHFQTDVERNHQHMELNLSETMPLTMLNAQAIERAISQIVDNAVNFTPADGEIVLCTRVEAATIEIAVHDTGIGIAPDTLEHIFEHFYRADQARSTRTGGSGLGLTIARKIIEGHGGKITVASVVGEGTTFYVALPITSTAGNSVSNDINKPAPDGDQRETPNSDHSTADK